MLPEHEEPEQATQDILSPTKLDMLTDAVSEDMLVPELVTGNLSSKAGHGITIDTDTVAEDDASVEAEEEGWEGLDDELELPAQDSAEEAPEAESSDAVQEAPKLKGQVWLIKCLL